MFRPSFDVKAAPSIYLACRIILAKPSKKTPTRTCPETLIIYARDVQTGITMQNFTFKARNSEGVLVVGDMQADRRETVVTTLKRKGYYLLNVKQQSRFAAVFRHKAQFPNRITISDRAVFTQQLATLLKAGMRLSVALKTLSKQTHSKYLASIIEHLQFDIEQSSSLSEAMARHPAVFPPVYTAIVRASEQSGNLAETLFVLSKQLKTRAAVSSRIRAALAYPVFLAVISTGVVLVLTTFVIPKFIELFVNVNQRLPWPTRMLVCCSGAVKNYWWLLLVGLFTVAGLAIAALKDSRLRLIIDDFLLRAPVVGPLNQQLQLARFARTLGSLLNGGVRIVQAVNTTKAVTRNKAFAAEIGAIEQAVLKGTTLAEAAGKQKHFTPFIANMIAVGEETGALPEMLLEVADMYDQQCETTLSTMTNLLGPVMIVLLGFIIGFVVMAILLPIFETSTMVA